MLKKIGYILIAIGMFCFLAQVIIKEEILKIYILYFVLTLIGGILILIHDINSIKHNKQVTLLERKSFIGLVFLILLSLFVIIYLLLKFL